MRLRRPAPRGIAVVGESRSGAVLYIRRHEGRGIGLGNKVAAYELQDQGLDTVEANSVLGFKGNARDYRDAAEMIQVLGFSDIRLSTNNPHKRAALQRYGVRVRADVPLVLPSDPYNAVYLATKRDKMGHRLPVAEDDNSPESGLVSLSTGQGSLTVPINTRQDYPASLRRLPVTRRESRRLPEPM